MGLADLVPGISGGTIALITNIYMELINTIKSFNIRSIKLLFELKFKKFYSSTNLKFLIPLVLGILFSIFFFASFFTKVIEYYPIHIFSLFFGLIFFSAFLILRNLNARNLLDFSFFFVGLFLGIIITLIKPIPESDSLFSIFLSGLIAICAMILPGISGSTILLVLGKYTLILDSIKNLDFQIIFVFGIGTLFGVIFFSRIISWLLNKYYTRLMFFLSGIMIGSLNKIWPWKIENNIVSPFEYSETLNQSNYFLESTFIFLIAGFFIFIFELRKKKI